MKRIILALVSTAVFTAGGVAQAQGRVGETYVGARLGAVIPQHDDLDGFDNGFAFEFTIGHRLNPNFAVEASIGRFALSGTASGYDSISGAYLTVDEDVSAIPVLASAKIIAPVGNLELYGLAGVGVYFVSARADVTDGFNQVSMSDDDSTFGIHVGAGLAARLSPQVVIGLEGKYVIGSARIWDATNHFDSMLIGGSLNYTF